MRCLVASIGLLLSSSSFAVAQPPAESEATAIRSGLVGLQKAESPIGSVCPGSMAQ